MMKTCFAPLLAALSAGLFSAVVIGGWQARAAADEGVSKFRVYVGTYTGVKSKGIYRCDLVLATGALSAPQLAAEVTSPSFLAIHPSGRFVYSVNEISDLGGKKVGGVTAFAVDPTTGNLSKLSQESSGGAGPCHLVVDKAGRNVLAANYGGGSACVLPIAADGKVGAATAFVQHVGSGANKQRQESPHAHSINLDPANRFAFVADLGLDKVLVYKFDGNAGKIVANDPPAASVDAGAGPRHFAFHPTGRFAYVINEMHCTVTAFAYDADRGVLKPVQTITTLPDGVKPGYSTAEVQVHPSGKFLYGSNRGHHSIAAFAINQETGQLTAVGHATEKIKTPRNFGIDPTGKFVIVANQDGDSLVVFRVNQQTGQLEPTGHSVEVPTPVCVKFLALKG